MRQTFVFKLKPTASQAAGLQRYLDVAREVYNAALEQRIAAWARGEHRSWVDQSREIKDLRESGLLGGCHVHTVQGALRRLDRAYQAFFARCAVGAGSAGFPRYKARRHWRSVEFKQYGQGCALRGGRLRVLNVGLIRVRLHRGIVGKPKTVAIVRKADGWYCHIVCDTGPAPVQRRGDRTTGIDLGLEAYATLSDGERIANPRFLLRAQGKLKAEQRALSRKQRGSSRSEKQRRRLALAHLRVARSRRDFHHKLARDLVTRFDRIAVEDLAVAAMRSSAPGPTQAALNRSMADAAWAQFVEILAQKCESEGVELIRVDPRLTSQACSGCRATTTKDLGTRWHDCACGVSLHRDHNAAINIETWAWAAPIVEAA